MVTTTTGTRTDGVRRMDVTGSVLASHLHRHAGGAAGRCGAHRGVDGGEHGGVVTADDRAERAHLEHCAGGARGIERGHDVWSRCTRDEGFHEELGDERHVRSLGVIDASGSSR